MTTPTTTVPTEPTEAMRVAEILKPYLGLINATPVLQSLMYDADMLPEQTVTVRGAISVAAVCEAYNAAAPVPSPHGKEVREAVARVIDPLFWERWDVARKTSFGSYGMSGEPEGRTEDPTCRRWTYANGAWNNGTKAFAKADAILALIPVVAPSEGVEP